MVGGDGKKLGDRQTASLEGLRIIDERIVFTDIGIIGRDALLCGSLQTEILAVGAIGTQLGARVQRLTCPRFKQVGKRS